MSTRRNTHKKTRRSKRCGKGMILRDAYTRKDGVHVPATCIQDRGLPGKGVKLFTVKKGGLTKYGYKLDKTTTERQKALGKARKTMPYARLIRKLNAIRILHKHTNPTYSKKLKQDMDWLKKTRKTPKTTNTRKNS